MFCHADFRCFACALRFERDSVVGKCPVQGACVYLSGVGENVSAYIHW